jgi:hypothetical protein
LLLFPILQSLLSASALSLEPKPTPFRPCRRRCCRCRCRRRRRRLCKPSPLLGTNPAIAAPFELPSSNTTTALPHHKHVCTPRALLDTVVTSLSALCCASLPCPHPRPHLHQARPLHAFVEADLASQWTRTLPLLAPYSPPRRTNTPFTLRDKKQLLGMCTVSLAGRAARRVKGLP